MNAETVVWFSVSQELTTPQIAKKLGDGLEPEDPTKKDLVLLRRGNRNVGCRMSPGILKIFANDLTTAARQSFGCEIGVS